ncbi:O-antigen ligase domain-containing protein [Crinalium epipsammum]|uniref:O-antigen ligase domain-containing protein n=1 Tax=Crinalium epipsammum TaxID=241425 RepID=UPI0012FBDF3F|nr:O-antigen ligase domain-containing protein [Crinalium epipsammum]
MTLKPAPAWAIVIGLILFTGLGSLAGAGSVIRLTFPLVSFAAGIFLYFRYPIFYIGFTWWMWFITPFAARLADYYSGSWDPIRLMLLGPYLVTLITLVVLAKPFSQTALYNSIPFILAILGVVYGFFISVVLTSPFTAIRALLDWLTPILFGFHLSLNWQYYLEYRQNLQRTFLWGTLLMGIYGIIQFLFAPEWDRFWLINTKIFTFGKPEPLGMRVWSTMNDSGTFAIFLIPGLLLLLNSSESLRFPASAIGYLALFLTRVRTAWLGTLVSILVLIGNLNLQRSIRIMLNMIVIAVLVFTLSSIEPFAGIIGDRLQTFSDLEADTSYNDRQRIYQGQLNSSLFEVIGRGIGNGVTDAGVLDVLASLGWLGGLLYISGILLLLFGIFQGAKVYSDSFINTALSSCISILTMMLGANTLRGPTGLIFWGFAGLAMAGCKYYSHQRNSQHELIA